MQKIVQDWILFGAFGLAFVMGLASFMAGVSFYHIIVRILVGTSAFLIVGGVIGGIMSRSLLKRYAALELEAARAAEAESREEAQDKAA